MKCNVIYILYLPYYSWSCDIWSDAHFSCERAALCLSTYYFTSDFAKFKYYYAINLVLFSIIQCYLLLIIVFIIFIFINCM